MAKASRPRRGLQRWLSETATPVFVLDARRVVLFFNQGCEQLTGWVAAEVIGKTCEYATDAEPTQVRSVTGRLCPPPDVFQGDPACVPVEFEPVGRDAVPALIHFFPVRETGSGQLRVLGVVTPRSEPCVGLPSDAELHAALGDAQRDVRRLYGPESIVAQSLAMRRVLEQMRVARDCRASVLFIGERGTGKEHLARAIHYHSDARARPFVPLDCRGLSPFELKRTLKRSLLPDDAESRDSADPRPGTLFLSSVGSLPRDVQEVVVSAGTGDKRPDVRLMSSSESALAPALEREELLPEFYYLVTELTIEVPPLRSRPDDLPLLAQQLLERLNRNQERQVGGFTPDVLEQFARYNWPGNVAELAAVVAEARAAAAAPLITPQDLPFRFRTGMDAQAIGPAVSVEPIDLEAVLAEVEAEHIRRALELAKNNKSQAAALLGLTRPRLYRRMEALGMVEATGDASGDDPPERVQSHPGR